jgi:hypothetical protein
MLGQPRVVPSSVDSDGDSSARDDKNGDSDTDTEDLLNGGSVDAHPNHKLRDRQG